MGDAEPKEEKTNEGKKKSKIEAATDKPPDRKKSKIEAADGKEVTKKKSKIEPAGDKEPKSEKPKDVDIKVSPTGSDDKKSDMAPVKPPPKEGEPEEDEKKKEERKKQRAEEMEKRKQKRKEREKNKKRGQSMMAPVKISLNERQPSDVPPPPPPPVTPPKPAASKPLAAVTKMFGKFCVAMGIKPAEKPKETAKPVIQIEDLPANFDIAHKLDVEVKIENPDEEFFKDMSHRPTLELVTTNNTNDGKLFTDCRPFWKDVKEKEEKVRTGKKALSALLFDVVEKRITILEASRKPKDDLNPWAEMDAFSERDRDYFFEDQVSANTIHGIVATLVELEELRARKLYGNEKEQYEIKPIKFTEATVIKIYARYKLNEDWREEKFKKTKEGAKPKMKKKKGNVMATKSSSVSVSVKDKDEKGDKAKK